MNHQAVSKNTNIMQLIATPTINRSLLIEEGDGTGPQLDRDTFCEEGDVSILQACAPDGIDPGDYYLVVVRGTGHNFMRKLTAPLTVAWVEAVPYSGVSEVVLNKGYESPQFAARLRDIYERCS